MRAALMRAVLGATAVCGVMTAAIPASAGDLSTCITAEEATAFSLRHLQSRLMVAGLACNQRDAYNNFVEEFRPPLADAGADFIAYFQRTGGGQTALNRHVTELANVAGLSRAENPEGFCQETWNMFLLLEEDPAALETLAISHMMHRAGAPTLCVAPAAIAPPVPSLGVPSEPAGVVKAAAEVPAYTVD